VTLDKWDTMQVIRDGEEDYKLEKMSYFRGDESRGLQYSPFVLGDWWNGRLCTWGGRRWWTCEGF